MKKLLLLALCLLSFSFSHAQTVVGTFSSAHIHVIETDSMWHDSTECSAFTKIKYAITVDSSFSGDTLRVIDTSTGAIFMGPYVNTTGASPWLLNISDPSYGSTWEIDIPTSGGYFYFSESPVKITTGLDTLRYVTYRDSLWIIPCLYDTISGNIYADNNSNCTYDAGDWPIYYVYPDIIEYLSSPTGSLHNYYWWYSIPGTQYRIIAQKSWMTSVTMSLPSSYAFIFPYSPCFSGTPYTFTALPQTHIDFPLQCTSNIDVQCYALSPGRVRLHRPFYLNPYVSNTGCSLASGTLTLVKDSRVSYDASLSTLPADTVRGDTLIWNYVNLTNVSSGAYWNSLTANIYLTPDSTLTAGDTLCFRVYTNILPDDINTANNDYTICMPVVYSFDPNSKDVSPAGTGANGQLPDGTKSLTYTINFQNTGSDAAYDVTIIDTLDSHLDPKSLRILGASHNMTPKWLASNIVEFDFPDIMLPDSSSNEPASHGQVQFSIAFKPNLPVGTQVKNTAYIYFDSNPAVVTNTTLNTTAKPSSVEEETAAKQMKVYPNPATDELNIEGLNTGDITVLNMSGSVLIRQHISGAHTTLDISRLPAGVYMLKTVNDAGVTTTKFSKY